MTLTVKTTRNEYAFDGPFSVTSNLKDQSGVYLVTTKAPNGKHDVIDVGESGKVKDRIENHDWADDWPEQVKEGIYSHGLLQW